MTTVASNESARIQTVKRGTPTLVQSTYEAIREDILSGQLKPGNKLRADQLKNEYGVGASTLREALNLLVGEALVISEGQRGFRVASMSESDFRDIVRVRKLMETEALRDSIANGDDQWEAGVVTAFHLLSKIEGRIQDDPEGLSGEWERCNQAFHLSLTAACRSPWLNFFINTLFRQSERYRRVAVTLSQDKKHRRRDVHAEHEEIYNAVMARDPDRACELLVTHIDRTLNYLKVEGFLDQLSAHGS